MYIRERQKARRYKQMLCNIKKENKTLKDKASNIPDEYPILRNIFNEDQVEVLKKRKSNRSSKGLKWSNSTITKSLKLKFSCGGNGYEELLKQGHPLPSKRTLQRRLQNLTFDSGILIEVFEFLQTKVESFCEFEKDCVLVLDEMAITPGNTYDSSLSKYFGDVTLPEHTGIATHVLVFMLGGITVRWKQVVAYYYTSNSVNGTVFKDIIMEILKRAEELKLNILSVTSDMGASNQALWKALGVMAGRHSETKCKIPHPINNNEYVYMFADAPHLFKNIKSMLLSNKIIRIPDTLKEKYKLPTNEIRANHISEIAAYQEEHEFKLAPRLSEADLLPSHFNKMKVSTSTNIISHNVSSALKFLAEEMKKPEYLTTAWFLDQVEQWFYLMTSRHPSSALSKYNKCAYTDSITFLKDFMHIFKSLEVGVKKVWKPSQTGVLITTQSLLELQEHLLENKQYKFILTSRFTQDCLENLFCVLRSKQVVPNALQVKNHLKLICVAQYLKNPIRGSYDEDDREFLSGFLDTLPHLIRKYDEVKIPEQVNYDGYNLNFSELNSLYNVCGYLVHSIMKTSKTCPRCLAAVGSKKPIKNVFSKFTNLKRFKENTLFFCTEEFFHFVLQLEWIFKKFFPIVSTQNINLKEFYLEKMNSKDVSIPECHRLKYKFINRFVTFRLKIRSMKRKASSAIYASKSVAGHCK
ncbi:hypothetical protein PPYR_01584 [Photinus pyralis]|uniref:THAP-type domain-containing protein n=2 Tax=Photinus pyralis TaxID=7054 RepID=A0A5N4B4Y4_PHOPY|nr:hypothetical protein PPYR_01584 [Photinus pyralis]